MLNILVVDDLELNRRLLTVMLEQQGYRVFTAENGLVALSLLDEQKIDNVLHKVGLRNKGFKMPYEMSGGEQQRVDIARALLNNPKLIIADEPTGNLDPDTRDEIMQLLFNICNDYNAAVIMATHDYNIIQKYPARVVRIEHSGVKEISVAGM